MSDIKVTIDASRFKKFLQDSPEKFNRALQNTIYKSSLLVERGAKLLSPVDTGRLRASISTEIRPLSATVSTHTNYAVFVHDGTRFMSARPFMKQAGDNVNQLLDGILSDEVKAQL